jgi:heat shock protein HtpX
MAERLSFYDEIGRNKRNSILLIIVVFLLIIFIGYVVGEIYDPTLSVLFIIVAAVIAILQVLNSYYNGDKIVLAATGAKEAAYEDQRVLHNLVEGLAIAAGVPKPKIYVIESTEMNAFATGRNPEHSSIAVTTGLLDKLNKQELEGVIGHEMSHIRNYDIQFAMLVAVLVGLIAIVSYIFTRSLWFGGGVRSDNRERGNGGAILIIIGIILAIVAPIVVRLVQLAISRQREFLADSTGAMLTRYPPGLAAALEKIGKTNKGNMNVSEAVSHLFFVDPVHTFIDNLTSTHPPIQERIKRLRAM